MSSLEAKMAHVGSWRLFLAAADAAVADAAAAAACLQQAELLSKLQHKLVHSLVVERHLSCRNINHSTIEKLNYDLVTYHLLILLNRYDKHSPHNILYKLSEQTKINEAQYDI